MNINVKHSEQEVSIYLIGSFDATVGKDIRDTFNGLLIDGFKNFAVYMEKVDFIDSSGLGILVGFYKKVKSSQGDLTLFDLSDNVLKLFQLTQLDQVFDLA